MNTPEGFPSPQPQETTPATPTQQLSEVFANQGIESRVIQVPTRGEFSEAIVLKSKKIPIEPAEPRVRLFRGIAHLDDSVLKQVPYAMRAETETGRPKVLEEVRSEVEAFAKDPTYEHLIAYATKVRPSLSPQEIARFDEDLKRIENGVLAGDTTRKLLSMLQIGHGGGWWGESGITPYLSATLNPYEAVGYARGGIIVCDVPLSRIEDLVNPNSTEVNIKGALDPNDIIAILPRTRQEIDDRQAINQALDRVLEEVYKGTPAHLYTEQELRAARDKIFTEKEALDKEQWKIEVEQVSQKRLINLGQLFPEVNLALQAVTSQGVQGYAEAQGIIFDSMEARLKAIGKPLDQLSYRVLDTEEPRAYDRGTINEAMLLKLKEHVEMLERRHKL